MWVTLKGSWGEDKGQGHESRSLGPHSLPKPSRCHPAQLIGGGLPCGCLLVLLEDAYSQHHTESLLAHFIAQGLATSQPCVVAASTPLAGAIVNRIPRASQGPTATPGAKNEAASQLAGAPPRKEGQTSAPGGVSPGSAHGGPPPVDDGLRIAWQYRRFMAEQEALEARRKEAHTRIGGVGATSIAGRGASEDREPARGAAGVGSLGAEGQGGLWGGGSRAAPTDAIFCHTFDMSHAATSGVVVRADMWQGGGTSMARVDLALPLGGRDGGDASAAPGNFQGATPAASLAAGREGTWGGAGGHGAADMGQTLARLCAAFLRETSQAAPASKIEPPLSASSQPAGPTQTASAMGDAPAHKPPQLTLGGPRQKAAPPPPPPPPRRIAIPSLVPGLVDGPVTDAQAHEASLVRAIHTLRGLLRASSSTAAARPGIHPAAPGAADPVRPAGTIDADSGSSPSGAVAMLVLPTHLFTRSAAARVQHLADIVLQALPLPGPETAIGRMFSGAHNTATGLLRVVKLSAPNTLVPLGRPEGSTYVIHQSHRHLRLEPLHLGPEDLDEAPSEGIAQLLCSPVPTNESNLRRQFMHSLLECMHTSGCALNTTIMADHRYEHTMTMHVASVVNSCTMSTLDTERIRKSTQNSGYPARRRIHVTVRASLLTSVRQTHNVRFGDFCNDRGLAVICLRKPPPFTTHHGRTPKRKVAWLQFPSCSKSARRVARKSHPCCCLLNTESSMKVQFWGTRGSISKAGKETVRCGGHTSCVQITTNSGTQLILDCGTGAHGLGMQLARQRKPVNAHILITHTHWDHIQGLPFFTPLFIPGNNVQIYGPHGLSAGLRDALCGQMQYTYFPISMEAFASVVEFHDLSEETFSIGDITITTLYMNHPAITLGYRIAADGATVVYCTDHEPHCRTLADGGRPAPSSADDRHCAFMRGADLLIHDCQYTACEYPQKVGWGHSTLEYVVDMATHAQVRQVALFHHDPNRSDAEVDAMVEAGNERALKKGTPRWRMPGTEAPPRLQVTAAREQYSCWLGEDDDAPGHVPKGTWLSVAEVEGMVREEGSSRAEESSRASRVEHWSPVDRTLRLSYEDDASLLLVAFVTDPAVRECVREGAQADPRIRPYFAESVADLRQLVAKKRPPLLVLGKTLEGAGCLSGIELFDSLRGEYPGMVCMIACEDGFKGREHPEVADWLQWPFSPAYARTRISAMLLRHESKWVAADRTSSEERRLAALHDLRILDTGRDPRYDNITSMCMNTFKVSFALVSLVEADRQWFKSVGGNVGCLQTSRDKSFCAHTILQDQVLEIPDTTADPRFAANPMVTGSLRLRFYAGVPLVAREGCKVGTLCILDDRPKKLTDDELDVLKQMALLVTEVIQVDRAKAHAKSQAHGRNGAGMNKLASSPNVLFAQAASKQAVMAAEAGRRVMFTSCAPSKRQSAACCVQ
eukprot:jgi/Mesvir1/17741/Mv05597-RA.1